MIGSSTLGSPLGRTIHLDIQIRWPDFSEDLNNSRQVRGP